MPYVFEMPSSFPVAFLHLTAALERVGWDREHESPEEESLLGQSRPLMIGLPPEIIRLLNLRNPAL